MNPYLKRRHPKAKRHPRAAARRPAAVFDVLRPPGAYSTSERNRAVQCLFLSSRVGPEGTHRVACEVWDAIMAKAQRAGFSATYDRSEFKLAVRQRDGGHLTESEVGKIREMLDEAFAASGVEWA